MVEDSRFQKNIKATANINIATLNRHIYGEMPALNHFMSTKKENA